jgi:hypothetical protein
VAKYSLSSSEASPILDIRVRRPNDVLPDKKPDPKALAPARSGMIHPADQYRQGASDVDGRASGELSARRGGFSEQSEPTRSGTGSRR